MASQMKKQSGKTICRNGAGNTYMTKYTMSEERIKADQRRSDWDRRIEVLTLINQGWSMSGVARHLGISRQAVSAMYGKIKNMSVIEAEQIVADIEETLI